MYMWEHLYLQYCFKAFFHILLSKPDGPDHLSKLIGNKLQSIASEPQYPASNACASPYGALYWSKSTMMCSPTVRLITSLTLICLIVVAESIVSTLQYPVDRRGCTDVLLELEGRIGACSCCRELELVLVAADSELVLVVADSELVLVVADSEISLMQGIWSLFLLLGFGACSCCGRFGACSCCGTSRACEGFVGASRKSCDTRIVDDEACPLEDFSRFLKRFTFCHGCIFVREKR